MDSSLIRNWTITFAPIEKNIILFNTLTNIQTLRLSCILSRILLYFTLFPSLSLSLTLCDFDTFYVHAFDMMRDRTKIAYHFESWTFVEYPDFLFVSVCLLLWYYNSYCNKIIEKYFLRYEKADLLQKWRICVSKIWLRWYFRRDWVIARPLNSHHPSPFDTPVTYTPLSIPPFNSRSSWKKHLWDS